MGHSLGNNYGKFYSFQSKPVLLDLEFTVDDTQVSGVSNIKGQGVQAVYMHSAHATPSSINPAVGIALIQLRYNYTRSYSGPWRIKPPLTGSNLAINASALTAGQPYVITAVGAGSVGVATIAPVADVSGSLASSWFSLYDAYGNTWVIWMSVNGVGVRPNLGAAAADGAIGLHYVQQALITNETAANVGAKLVITIQALPSGVAGVYSFTAAGTTTVTATSTAGLLAGIPSEGLVPTGFTFALTKYTSNLQDWQAVGLPKGVVPAVGVSFVATATGYSTGGGSSGTVKAVSVSGISALETIGDSNLSLAPIPMGGSPNVGGWILVQFLGATDASTTTMIPKAPAAGSLVKMQYLLEGASRVGGNNE